MALMAYPHINQIKVAYIFLDAMEYSPVVNGKKG